MMDILVIAIYYTQDIWVRLVLLTVTY